MILVKKHNYHSTITIKLNKVSKKRNKDLWLKNLQLLTDFVLAGSSRHSFLHHQLKY